MTQKKTRWLDLAREMRLVSQRLVAEKPDLVSIATRDVGGGELDGGTQGVDPRFGGTA